MVEGALGAASGLQAQDYQGFSGASTSQRSARTNQMVDPNSREATLSRKNNLVMSGLVLATITGKYTICFYNTLDCVEIGVHLAFHLSSNVSWC